MTVFVNDEERNTAMAAIAGKNIEDEDLRYFRDKLIQGLERGQTIASLSKIIKQLDLMEDAIVVYQENRPTEE